MPSHYLNQCWNIVNLTLGNKFQWNLNRNWYIFIQENAFENVVWKMTPMSRPQGVKNRNPSIYLKKIVLIWNRVMEVRGYFMYQNILSHVAIIRFYGIRLNYITKYFKSSEEYYGIWVCSFIRKTYILQSNKNVLQREWIAYLQNFWQRLFNFTQSVWTTASFSINSLALEDALKF